MSALGGKADMRSATIDVCFRPKADMGLRVLLRCSAIAVAPRSYYGLHEAVLAQGTNPMRRRAFIAVLSGAAAWLFTALNEAARVYHALEGYEPRGHQ